MSSTGNMSTITQPFVGHGQVRKSVCGGGLDSQAQHAKNSKQTIATRIAVKHGSKRQQPGETRAVQKTRQQIAENSAADVAWRFHNSRWLRSEPHCLFAVRLALNPHLAWLCLANMSLGYARVDLPVARPRDLAGAVLSSSGRSQVELQNKLAAARRPAYSIQRLCIRPRTCFPARLSRGVGQASGHCECRFSSIDAARPARQLCQPSHATLPRKTKQKRSELAAQAADSFQGRQHPQVRSCQQG